MDRRILDALGRQPGIHDWTVRRQAGHSVQLYLVGRRLENVRRVAREAYEVELFNDHRHDGKPARGGMVMPLARTDLDGLDAILADGVTVAELVHNPPWQLPGPMDFPEAELADPALTSPDAALAAGREAIEQIRELTDAHARQGVRLSAAELFITLIDEDLLNSRGVEGSSTSTRVLLELTLLAGEDGADAEAFRQLEARRLDDLRLPDAFAELAEAVSDRLHATAPRTGMAPVIMSGAAVGQLLGGTVVGNPNAFLFQASGAAQYMKLSRFEPGRAICGDRQFIGDRLTMRANARLPFAVAGYRFDADGIPAHDVLVIEDGVFRSRPATKRYADYLGIPATGRATMAQVPPGTRTSAELLAVDERAYQVLAFSAANVDELTGNFGMEIRIGYELGPDGSRRPVKGGSVSGNLFEAMSEVYFSSETTLLPQYAGPAALRFGGLQVAGED